MEFSAQLQLIQERGLRVAPLPEVLEKIRGGQALTQRTVAITFDDGYVSVFTEAFPRLRKLSWPFAVFVQTGAVGSPGYVTWEQLREMAEAGATIANHSRSHEHLIRRRERESERAWLARIVADIEDAEAVIERETGQSLRYHAYPYGEYNDAIKAALRERGYVGFGQQSGAVGPLSDFAALPRFPVAGDYAELDEFAVKVQSLPLPVLDQETLPDPQLPDDALEPILEIRLSPGDYDLARLACYASGQGAMVIESLGPRAFRAIPKRPLPPGRSRYNCTAPQHGSNRYYWFSYQWVRPGGTD